MTSVSWILIVSVTFVQQFNWYSMNSNRTSKKKQDYTRTSNVATQNIKAHSSEKKLKDEEKNPEQTKKEKKTKINFATSKISMCIHRPDFDTRQIVN